MDYWTFLVAARKAEDKSSPKSSAVAKDGEAKVKVAQMTGSKGSDQSILKKQQEQF